MAKMLQVRNLPEPLHRELSRRAKSRRMTLTAYVQSVLEREVEEPEEIDVLVASLRAAPRVDLSDDVIVDSIRASREELDEKWDGLSSTRRPS